VFGTLFSAAVGVFFYALALIISEPVVKNPKETVPLNMIANSQKTADEAVIAASRNSAALVTLASDQKARSDALEALIRKSAEDDQKRMDGLNRRLATVEELVRNPKRETAGALTRQQAMEIQRALQARGYRPGPIDGVFGTRTSAAIRAYQAQRPDHPAVTGILTDDQVSDLLR